jgi:endonuclease IV
LAYAFQIFSSNPRKWCSKTISPESAKRFLALQRQFDLSLVVDHMPYLPNLASAKEVVYAKSVEALARELERCRALGIPYLVTHLDRHEHIGLGQIGEQGFRAILCHPALVDRTMILETPVDDRRDDRGNLDVAKRLASGIK